MSDEDMRADIDALPLRVRWRYRLKPGWLRVAINRLWPGRWSQQEVDQITARAHERAAQLRDATDA